MGTSVLQDAFGHHIWATLELLDACSELDQRQLEEACPGTYGPVIGTLRHLIGADSSYLNVLSDGGFATPETSGLGISDLRAVMEKNAAGWAELLEGEQALDPEEIKIRRRANGSESHAPVSIRFAQALHHGSDHRSQICTALTMLGTEPPGIDVWDYALAEGRFKDVPAPTT